MISDTSPDAALRWLSRPEVIASLGAKHSAGLRRRFQSIVNRARSEGCSGPRIDAAIAGVESVRVPGMVLSREPVRLGDGVPSRRWTPPQAVQTEDRYDRMNCIQAAACADPPSGTGAQFQMMQMRGKRILCKRLTVSSSRVGAKKASPQEK